MNEANKVSTDSSDEEDIGIENDAGNVNDLGVENEEELEEKIRREHLAQIRAEMQQKMKTTGVSHVVHRYEQF